MIKYSMLLATTAFAVLTGCKKTLSKGDTDFQVAAQKTTLAIGDTAMFSFTGNPDVVTFYSGEIGKRYEYRNRTSADGTPVLSFGTKRENGSQANSLAILVSNNFPGVAVNDTATTLNNIASATWNDITARTTLSTGAFVTSSVDLSDFAALGKPVFVAFKYVASAGSLQNKWTISGFGINNTLPDASSYTIANMNSNNVAYTNYGVSTYSPGFVTYKIQNSYSWAIGTNLVITGATSTAAATAPAEAWAIIGPINLKKVTPDIGMVVKTVSQNMAGLMFNYRYSSVGSYNAIFTGGRVSSDESEYTVDSIKIVIQ